MLKYYPLIHPTYSVLIRGEDKSRVGRDPVALWSCLFTRAVVPRGGSGTREKHLVPGEEDPWIGGEIPVSPVLGVLWGEVLSPLYVRVGSLFLVMESEHCPEFRLWSTADCRSTR
jgi:hypothetical protein